MRVHLVDGTYELFRHHFALPSRLVEEREVAAVAGVVGSILSMLEDGATHLGVATDEVIESFRNRMWPGYKTGEGIEPALLEQFPLLEDALRALGVRVWAMREYEADDALASAAFRAATDPRAEQILICTPDKDLAQCVVDDRVVQFDRRKRELRDEDGVVERFGVLPESIPDYLALVGDSADGFPGIKGWGAKSAAAVLARYGHLEEIPDLADRWSVTVRGAAKLAATLATDRDQAMLFRDLATLRRDADVFDDLDELRWTGPSDGFASMCERIGASELAGRADALAVGRR